MAQVYQVATTARAFSSQAVSLALASRGIGSPTGNATCAKRRVASRSRWNACAMQKLQSILPAPSRGRRPRIPQRPRIAVLLPGCDLMARRGAAGCRQRGQGRCERSTNGGCVPAGTCVAQRGHTVCPPALGRKHDDVRFDFDTLTPAARSARLDTAPARRFVQRRARCDFPGARRALVRAVPRSTAAPARPHRALTGLAFALPRPSR